VPIHNTAGNFSQAKQRRNQMFRDQHGRKYFASIEIKTGDPCGVIEHQFDAPLRVPAMYLEKSRDPERPYDLHINYTRWKSDIRAAREEWERDGRDKSRKAYGTAFDPSKPFTPEILEQIGPAPQAVEPVIAAEQGNSWVLGLTTKIDPRLYDFFADEIEKTKPIAEPDFRDLDAEEMDEEQETPKEKLRRQDRERKAAPARA
jgi:hypothetical protein